MRVAEVLDVVRDRSGTALAVGALALAPVAVWAAESADTHGVSATSEDNQIVVTSNGYEGTTTTTGKCVGPNLSVTVDRVSGVTSVVVSRDNPLCADAVLDRKDIPAFLATRRL
jgi:hypothetical protein